MSSQDPVQESRDETQARPCPVCGKPAVFAFRPFCSKRCADIDLHRWLGGVYAIPAEIAPGREGGGEESGSERPEGEAKP
ncbi:MAG TPA: DNA gyrase inhibitor YacG [Methylocella sp.]|nr:DNA gyrase inhibitor YacG [Methylocella sp.]